MPVEYITGNALDFPGGANVLAHGCNTLGGVFGAGFAKQVAAEYPAALEADKEAAAAGQNTLGSFSVAEVGSRRIVNLYTQERVGADRRQVDYEAVYYSLSALHALLRTAHSEGRIFTLCMPWIGCGLAGGSRKVVAAMIEDIFSESPVKCIVVDRPDTASTK